MKKGQCKDKMKQETEDETLLTNEQEGEKETNEMGQYEKLKGMLHNVEVLLEALEEEMKAEDKTE